MKFGFADPEGKIPTTSDIRNISSANASVELPSVTIDSALFDAEKGLWIAKLIVEAGLAKSTSEARRLVQGNAVSIDDVKITDPSKQFRREDLKDSFVLKTGKKNFKRIVIR